MRYLSFQYVQAEIKNSANFSMPLKDRTNHFSEDHTLEAKKLFLLPSEVADTTCEGFCAHLPFITGNHLTSAFRSISVTLSMKQES